MNTIYQVWQQLFILRMHSQDWIWLTVKQCIRFWYGYWPNLFTSTGYDVAGPVAIGLTHWKNPYVQGRPTLPSDLPLFLSKDAGIPVYHQSFTRKADLATPLSCPASLSITPVPSYSSSSQETLSQDTTGNSVSLFGGSGLGISNVLSFISLLTRLCLCFCLCDALDSHSISMLPV